ncbi:MAG TPA: response regulator [Blastocatellia bacterium]|nr:response regulator [Blastocatellia bacterium]
MDNTSDPERVADRLTLLVIDDDADWTDLLKFYFISKYQVQVVNVAGDAIEAIKQSHPDLIIVDLVMPSMDGFGIIHRIRSTNDGQIPIILVTGWKTQEVEECAASVGCAGVFGKPVSLPHLEEAISSLVRAPAAVSAASL